MADAGDALGPRRMAATEDMRPVLALLQQAFAYMEGRIAPPSSLGRMDVADLVTLAQQAELWVVDGPQGPLACMVLTPQSDTLYLGKLAVAAAARGQGLARRMIACSLERARLLGLPSVSLQSRIELVENHAAFAALGFGIVGTTTHQGYDRPTAVTFMQAV